MSAADTPTVLDRILQSTREALRSRKLAVSPEALRSRAVSAAEARPDRVRGSFHRALREPGIGVIAEFKRRSPSAGALCEQADLHEILGAYRRGGAAAVSVLTEEANFGGSLEDLRSARQACELPILRKDFVVDTYQLHEALLAGADAVLLIVAALGKDELASLHNSACQLGLDVLVEVHDHDELRDALGIGATLVGVNNRDLRDFSVDLDRTMLLMSGVPAGVTVVSESGISTTQQLHSLRRAGVAAVLVGQSLMCATNPQAALRALVAVDSADVAAADMPSARI